MSRSLSPFEENLVSRELAAVIDTKTENGSLRRLVILSPHYDDAAFSCGGTLLRTLQHGEVIVINLFSSYSGLLSKSSFVSGEVRETEEAAAARQFGFSSWPLGEKDVVVRRSGFEAGGKLFLPPDNEELRYLDDLVERLQSMLSGMCYDFVLAPLGVGWHVDHILCHLAARRLIGRAFDESELFFYEDAPYCFIPEFTDLRIKQIASSAGSDGDDGDSLSGTLKRFKAILSVLSKTAVVRRNPNFLQPIINCIISGFLARLPSRHLMDSCCGSDKVSLAGEIRYVEKYFEAKMLMCGCYETQLQEFFSGPEQMKDFYLAHSRGIDNEHGYVERYWRLA